MVQDVKKLGNWSVYLSAVVGALAVGSISCESGPCSQMRECCAEAKTHPDVGKSCGPLTRDVSETKTCRTVLETVRAIYEESDKSLPDACQESSSS